MSRPGVPRKARGGGEAQRVVVVSSPGAAAEESERLAALVTEYCPTVESVRLGVCAFAARGPARYFGGEEALGAKLVEAAAAAGLGCRVGVADGLFAALLAAAPAGGADLVTVVPGSGTQRFLARQPVSVLDDEDLAGLLTRLGIRTLGDFAALPADAVASRFGEAGVAAYRLACGEQPRPLAVSVPPDDLAVTADFDPPQPLAEPVVFAAKALAERLHAVLAARGMSCVRIDVQVSWADGRRIGRLWRHDGLLTAVQVADRVRWQLEGVAAAAADDGDGGGITMLRLVPDQLGRAAGQQLALWGDAVIPDRAARAAMRVQALLGQDAVLRPVPSGGRSVRDQMHLCPFGADLEPRRPAGRPWPGRISGPAPAVVYPEPRPARVTDAAGEPVTVSGRCAVSGAPAGLAVDGGPPLAVTGWAGPWPLAERWWDPDGAVREARFQLISDDGRAWLAAVRDGAWQVEAGYW
jgi:protein ImuB